MLRTAADTMSVTAGNISGNDGVVRTEESRDIMRRKDSNKMKVTAGDYLIEYDGNAEHMLDDIEALCLIHRIV